MKIKVIDFLEGSELTLPFRAHYNDAGADVYCPKDAYIPNNRTFSIGLGFGVMIPDGHMGLILPRSSLAKAGITIEIPPIDSGYRGEIHALVHNHSGSAIKLAKGERIGQLVIVPVVIAEFVRDLPSERGLGAFGSTGA